MALYAFDGTWNDSSRPDSERNVEKDTNVHRFRELYDQRERVCYVDGIGSRYGLIGKYVGGALGVGANRRISEQFLQLKENFRNGNTTIDIVGYSRGAAIARMFVHTINESFFELEENGKPLAAAPRVRFLGLFDTVASFGVPWSEAEGDFDPSIPNCVENTYHAMALDESRDTFGLERCVGDRTRITEVWFRGGHGDIGGNATVKRRDGTVSNNKARTEVALGWMLRKALACGLPVSTVTEKATELNPHHDVGAAPVLTSRTLLKIGDEGTRSRRVHSGDLVHYSVEEERMTQSADGTELRRIATLTLIEDKEMESSKKAIHWTRVPYSFRDWGETEAANLLSIERLSLSRYPFDVLPARRWKAWLDDWNLSDATPESDAPSLPFDQEIFDDFWAPTSADRALAFDMLVEIRTRILDNALGPNEGTDLSALESVHSLFPSARQFMHKHGYQCANCGRILNAYLNTYVRRFTTKFHPVSISECWKDNPLSVNAEFRKELSELVERLVELVEALKRLARASI